MCRWAPLTNGGCSSTKAPNSGGFLAKAFGDAIDQQRQWEAKLALRAAGGELPEERARPTLQTLASEFLEEIKLRGLSDDSNALYSVTVNEFVKVTGRTYATDLVHKDVLRYINALLDRNRKSGRKNRPDGPLSKRTANNRVVALKSFFRFCKLDANELVPKRAKPKYDKKKPEAYSADELQNILGAVKTHGSAALALAVETAMKCGMRKAEIAHLEWREVDLAKQEIHLHSKEEHGFKIKDDEERVIKIEATLLNKLTDWRKKKLKSRLVFGTKNDKPNNKLLEQMKAACKKAGIKVNGRLIFHKFRSTFMTRMTKKLPIGTLMSITGHSDLKSVMRYLAAEDDLKQDAVDEVFGNIR